MTFEGLTAAELMTRELLTIAETETLRSAARAMHAAHVHCLIVPSREPNGCVGIVTAKDVVQVLCDAESALLDQLRVSDAMTTPSFSVQKDFLVKDCIRLMRMAGVRSVPVPRRHYAGRTTELLRRAPCRYGRPVTTVTCRRTSDSRVAPVPEALRDGHCPADRRTVSRAPPPASRRVPNRRVAPRPRWPPPRGGCAG